MTADDLLDQRCTLLAGCWAVWADLLGGLPVEGWTAPTRLGGWDVKALVAHHAAFVPGLAHLAAHPTDAPIAVPSAVAMLQGFNAPDGAARVFATAIAEMARAEAAAQGHEALTERFAVEGPQAIAAVRAAGPIVVDYFGNGTFPLVEALAIGLLEAVVHGLDLFAAVGRPHVLPDPALHAVSALLGDLVDPVAFIEVATGRRVDALFPVVR